MASSAGATIPRDIQRFIADYPGKEDDDATGDLNLRFYRNEISSRSSGDDDGTIEEIHTNWKGDYRELEWNHGYIQWLFPIQEQGMNYKAQILQRHEITAMRADPVIHDRIIESYRMMLDFYGMQLVDVDTGLISRSDKQESIINPSSNASRKTTWDGYRNFLTASHNWLRISRILKSLSEMNLERLNAGFLLHILSEQCQSPKQLNSRGFKSSMDGYWANCLRNESEREWIRKAISQVRLGEREFTRKMYEAALETRQKTGSFEAHAS